MKELEEIKRIENEILKKTELARRKAEKQAAVLKSSKDSIISERLRKADEVHRAEMERARASAEKEAAKLLKASDDKAAEIEKTAQRNFSKAVKMILEVFRNGGVLNTPMPESEP